VLSLRCVIISVAFVNVCSLWNKYRTVEKQSEVDDDLFDSGVVLFSSLMSSSHRRHRQDKTQTVLSYLVGGVN